MAFFPRTVYNNDNSFGPLFRLLNDFDDYSREKTGGSRIGSNNRGQHGVVSPKFDFYETKTSFELHGELPGIEKDNLVIEFTDPQSLVVRGHFERNYSTTYTRPAGLLHGKSSASSIEGGEEHHTHAHSHKVTKPTVEAEALTAGKEEKQEEHPKLTAPDDRGRDPESKVWMSERSFGEFSRIFSFPTRVDQDGVHAKLENGVLTVSIPKAKKPEARRVAVN